MWRKGWGALSGLVILVGMASCRPLPPRMYRGPVPHPAVAPAPGIIPGPAAPVVPGYRVIPGQVYQHEAVPTGAPGENCPDPAHTESAEAPEAPATPTAPAAVFYCPMHPTVTSDEPGTCPSCGMELFLKTEP